MRSAATKFGGIFAVALVAASFAGSSPAQAQRDACGDRVPREALSATPRPPSDSGTWDASRRNTAACWASVPAKLCWDLLGALSPG